MGEVFKVPIKTGDPGRPRTVQIRGGSDMTRRDDEPKIIGASTAGPIEIRDRTTPVDPQEVDVRVHEEVVLEDENRIRTAPKHNPGVEVRVRGGDSKEFEKVKRLEDQ